MFSPTQSCSKKSSESSETLSSAESLRIEPPCRTLSSRRSVRFVRYRRTNRCTETSPNPKQLWFWNFWIDSILGISCIAASATRSWKLLCMCSSVFWSHRDGICRSGTGPFEARREVHRGSLAVAFLDSCSNIKLARLDAG